MTPKQRQKSVDKAIALVTRELGFALEKHGRIKSAHEGYAVMLEELDEVKAWVWKQSWARDHYRMRLEAAHVAAMAIRFIIDCCDDYE